MASVLERYLERIDIKPDDGCIYWTGTFRNTGYGMIRFKGKRPNVHRVIWEILEGPIPEGMYIDHTCRNRGCVNTGHMRLVTPRQNALENNDSAVALNSRKTHCPKGHPLSGDNVYFRAEGKHRVCRECQRVHNREKMRYIMTVPELADKRRAYEKEWRSRSPEAKDKRNERRRELYARRTLNV